MKAKKSKKMKGCTCKGKGSCPHCKAEKKGKAKGASPIREAFMGKGY
jgi:hypothetical protein